MPPPHPENNTLLKGLLNIIIPYLEVQDSPMLFFRMLEFDSRWNWNCYMGGIQSYFSYSLLTCILLLENLRKWRGPDYHQKTS